MSYAADKQINRETDRQKQTDSKILTTPTDIVGVGNNNNNKSSQVAFIITSVIRTSVTNMKKHDG